VPGGIPSRGAKEYDTASPELLAQQFGAAVGQTARLIL
jgi:hypothetical protein